MRCSKCVPNGDVKEVVKLMYMEGSARLKILHALRGGKERKFNMQYLNGVSSHGFISTYQMHATPLATCGEEE